MGIEREIKLALETQRFYTQSELLEYLNQKGLEYTQGGISRVLKKMRIIKKSDELGKSYYSLPDEFSNSIMMVENNDHLVLIKVKPGQGMYYATQVDHWGIEQVLGTLAGDDTILVIPKSGVSPEILKKIIQKRLTER